MPKFFYNAKDYEGNSQSGEVVAKDEHNAAQKLRAEGLLVTSIEKGDKKGKESGEQFNFLDKLSTVPLKEKMVFTRNLGVMIGSGLTISRAIENLSAQVKNKKFKKILHFIHQDLQGGKNFSEALAKYPNVFSELFINMINVGETAGNLEEVLDILAEQLEKEHSLKSKVLGALIYPAVIVAAMVGIGILMLTYILPKITSVFEDMDVTLPPTTQFIITVSDIMRNNSLLVIIGFVIFIFSLRFFLKTEKGKKSLSFLLITLPAIKNIDIKVNCARFSRIYSSLLRSGVNAVESLEIVSRTLGNYYYKKAIEDSIEQIKKGVELSEIIAENKKIFPVLVSQMIEVGEETGKTDIMLAKLAEFYESEVDGITKNLSSIIEPILMILIGGAVGFFAISMLQPMYGLMENIQ